MKFIKLNFFVNKYQLGYLYFATRGITSRSGRGNKVPIIFDAIT